MGIVRTDESQMMEIEEFRRLLLLSCAGLNRTKDEDEFRRHVTVKDRNDDVKEKPVCVTSGMSFLGLAIVNQLLIRGYSVRLIVDRREDIERLNEMELSGEMSGTNCRIQVALAKLTEEESLSEAINGCGGVFHTASFVDPAGISGYSKSMADIEVKASENVIKVCAVTSSVRYCVLTSSLLACIWRDDSLHNLSPEVDHDCWSDETFCRDKKLWYALGKLRAEKAAWRVAEEMGLKLVTLCPGLITGPEFCLKNSTSTIAYLKGAQEMYRTGLLATIDVSRLAEAHVYVFEAMKKTAFGRYICFDHIIGTEDEVETLAQAAGIQIDGISGNASSNSSTRFELSRKKLSRLMSRTQRCGQGL